MAGALMPAGTISSPAQTAISPLTRFDTSAFQSGYAGTVAGLKYHQGDSLVMQMLTALFGESGPMPVDADLIVATTKGEIDLLEEEILHGPEGDI